VGVQDEAERGWGYRKTQRALGACGNEQVYGVNYTVTFSAVMEQVTCKFVFAIGVVGRVPAEHYDVPSAYPRAGKEDGLEVILSIPQGMIVTAIDVMSSALDTTSIMSTSRCCASRRVFMDSSKPVTYRASICISLWWLLGFDIVSRTCVCTSRWTQVESRSLAYTLMTSWSRPPMRLV
ncbi:TPA: hypothetical protein N0F65_005673, partial [Lagenidium giganteum]